MTPEQPDHLILRFLSGTATVAELHELEAWTTASNENKSKLLAFQKIWNERDLLSMPDFNSEAEWLKLKGRMNEERDNVRSLFGSGYMFKIAASLLLVALVSVFVYVTWFRSTTIVEQTAETIRQITLPDGSSVWLNRHSEISYASDFIEDRNTTLTGEAFFEVAPDPERPFVISTGEAIVKVLGTSFNVRAYKNETEQEVFVATGKVNVTAAKGSVDLVPGDLAILHKNNLALTSVHLEDENALAWKNRKLVFNKTNLEEVANILEHYFEISIVIKNPVLEKCRFTSSFNDPTLDEVIEAISLSLNLNVVHQNDDYTWDGEGCGKDSP